MIYHKPVLLNESVNGLDIKPEGIYVDVTFGGGGHSREILKHLTTGRLFAFDQDQDARINMIKNDNFKLVNANFRYFKRFLRLEGVKRIDGLLADLGVSSHQFDISRRGFSTRLLGPLDMRMNQEASLDAKYVVNNYSFFDLAQIFFDYGELSSSRKIARAVVIYRKKNKRIINTKQLVNCIRHLIPERNGNKFLSKVFQAIRIEVNDEIQSLKEMLVSATDLLRPKARLSVISYHSLEDKLVKNLIKKGNIEGNLQKDFFGNPIQTFNEINKKVIIPSDKEIKENSRARSAKLRIAEKK